MARRQTDEDRARTLAVGAWIASVRVAARLTQQELAKKIGVTTDGLRKWEQGVAAPVLLRALDAAAACEVSLSHLENFLASNPVVGKQPVGYPPHMARGKGGQGKFADENGPAKRRSPNKGSAG